MIISRIISRAPHSVSFFGEGTDDPAWYRRHGGCVLAAAITRYSRVHCRMRAASALPCLRLADYSRAPSGGEEWQQTMDSARRFLRISREIEAEYHLNAPFASGSGDRAEGAMEARGTETGETRTSGREAGEGRSARTVGLIHALHASQGRRPSRRRLAAESLEFMQAQGAQAGAAQTVLAAYGGIQRVQFHPNDAFRVTPTAISPERARGLQAHLLLFAPALPPARSLASMRGANGYGQRGQMLQLTGFAEEAGEILESGQDLGAFGALLHEAWRVGQAACPQAYAGAMQTLYAEARGVGAIGGKITGAGRLLLLFAPPDAHIAIRQRLRGVEAVPFGFDYEGSRIVTSPTEADERDEAPCLSFSSAEPSLHALPLYARAA